MKIDTVVFDLGGVIINGDDYIFCDKTNKVERLLDTSKSQLLKTWNKAWKKFRIGKITEDEFMYEYVKLSKQKENDRELISELKNTWRKEVKPLGTMKYLDTLKKMGNLYGLSNISQEWLKYKTQKFSLDKKFIKIFSSAEEKLAKPDLKIYKALIRKTGINPETAIFIDDSERNTGAARRLGFKTIHFKSEKEFLEKLKGFGFII